MEELFDEIVEEAKSTKSKPKAKRKRKKSAGNAGPRSTTNAGPRSTTKMTSALALLHSNNKPIDLLSFVIISPRSIVPVLSAEAKSNLELLSIFDHVTCTDK